MPVENFFPMLYIYNIGKNYIKNLSPGFLTLR